MLQGGKTIVELLNVKLQSGRDCKSSCYKLISDQIVFLMCKYGFNLYSAATGQLKSHLLIGQFLM